MNFEVRWELWKEILKFTRNLEDQEFRTLRNQDPSRKFKKSQRYRKIPQDSQDSSPTSTKVPRFQNPYLNNLHPHFLKINFDLYLTESGQDQYPLFFADWFFPLSWFHSIQSQIQFIWRTDISFSFEIFGLIMMDYL